MKKIVLANAPINNGNRGCVALSYCSIYLLDKVLGRGKYKLYLTNSHQIDGEHSILMGGESFEYTSITIHNFFLLKEL